MWRKEAFMPQTSKIVEEKPAPALDGSEIRVPTAGTWVGLGTCLLVVMAGVVWTIL